MRELKDIIKPNGKVRSGRVVRRTVQACSTVRRRLVIALEPGDVLAIREEYRQKWARAPISKVYVTIARWNADAEREAKKAARKSARNLRLEEKVWKSGRAG